MSDSDKEPLVYLACPYSHDDPSVRNHRFKVANIVAAGFMAKGMNVFSPLSHSHPIAEDGKLDALACDFWLRYDLQMMHFCSKVVVITIEGWQESKGVTAELKYARSIGLPVQYFEPPAADLVSIDTVDGRKNDSGKLQYGLIPPVALREMVRVLTFGAVKYAPDNWRKVPDAKRRYFDALQRHMWAWKEGEQQDTETGINHLAHAACCLFFMIELDM